MRTTLTLEDDLAGRLKEIAHRKRTSFKQVVDEALKAGARAAQKPVAKSRRLCVQAGHCRFLAGVDAGRLNQLV